MHNDSALLAGSLDKPQRKDLLCEKLCAIHGTGNRRPESSGEHLYIACPVCRANYGDREMNSRHLSVNLDLYVREDRHLKTSKSGKGVSGIAWCHKHSGPFTIAELLSYPVQPGITNSIVLKSSGERYLIPDGRGNQIPDYPGVTIPVINLPREHPAVLYLTRRDYDIGLLHTQFATDWCETEAPEGDEYGSRFYRKHADGWKSTPQGRIIFNCFVNGVRVMWQGRYLEIREDTPTGPVTWVWHPYHRAWRPEPVWDHKKSPIKYNTSPGAARNASLGGYDHAVRHSRFSGCDYCVLTEGPLDAARFPNTGICIFGKVVSRIQAILLARHFRRVVLGFDTDKAGREACEGAERMLALQGVRTVRFFPGNEPYESKSDIGEMGYTVAASHLQTVLARF